LRLLFRGAALSLPALALSCLLPAALSAQPVAVRRAEGLVHGFLTLSALDGTRLADGDLTQTARGGRVESRLVFRFKDGSLHDERVVFTQTGRFRLLRDRLVQKGPSFPHPIDLSVDAGTGRVVVRYAEDGEEKTISRRFELPSDLANGMLFTLLKNVRPETARTTWSLVVASPKPRLVRLVVSPAGEESFATGGWRRAATRFLVKIDIPGIAGAVAPLVGKQPPDSSVWILGGEAPAFVRSEGPLAMDAPPWRVELERPEWSGAPPERRQ
jgi:hypothetical protein